jgi:superfamily II DNA/RNA helicase
LFIKKAADPKTQVSYTPTQQFADFALSDTVKTNIAKRGYKEPTPIQEQAIPPILAGNDLIGIANTGTGKTAAFLVTLIHKALQDAQQRVLIVAPTRELAIQIVEEFRVFSHGTRLRVAALVGGANIKRQINSLRKEPQFVVGTPGRIKDLVNRNRLSLGTFQNVVLDEVDRMVDIGFIKDIDFIISMLPHKRQSLFFSATVDGKTRDILRKFVSDPVTVAVKQQSTSEFVDQDVVKLSGHKPKIDVLHELLIQPEFEKVIIFGRTKWGVEKLSNALVRRGFQSSAIHGNKSQAQRQRALDEFKSERIQVLTATDVASRGLDIDNVTHVINYDPPETYDDYVHRIGRTGRAGKRGQALTFIGG